MKTVHRKKTNRGPNYFSSPKLILTGVSPSTPSCVPGFEFALPLPSVLIIVFGESSLV
jgi:hypothetical protein